MTFAEVESIRAAYQAKLARIWRRCGIIILIVIIIALIIGISSSNSIAAIFGILFFVAMFSFIISGLIIAIATTKDATAYRQAYKAYFVAQNLSHTFTNLKYNHAAGLDPKLLRATGMINTGDRFHSNDLTVARYKDVAFIQADAHIEVEYTDSDGDTHYSTIFKGRFMIFEFPKKFSFKLEVIGKFFHAAKIPSKNPTTGRKMTRVKMESPEFNKLFHSYAEDGFEAFYLLDPAFIEKLQAIANQYRSRVLFGFIDNTLLIGLSNGKDAFEPPSPRHPLNEQTELAKVQADIKLITDFVDYLKLDRKLFKN